MSRPVFEWIEFGDGLDLAVSEFVAWKNAELVSGPEERDRHHEGAGERESVALSECKILCHVRNLRPERADPARWLLKGPGTVAIIAKAKPSDGSLLADPDRGLIDGDPDLVQDAIYEERDWFASGGPDGVSAQVVHLRHSYSPAMLVSATRPAGIQRRPAAS